MRNYDTLIQRLEDLHAAVADPTGRAVDALTADQRRALQTRIELCLLDLQKQLAELILVGSDEQFRHRQ